jgi:serine/threonine protein kinase
MVTPGLREAWTAQRNGEPWLAAVQDCTSVASFARSVQGCDACVARAYKDGCPGLARSWYTLDEDQRTEREVRNCPPKRVRSSQVQRTAATLSHPHLIRLLDAGRCQLGGHQFLFVVMEYAEETLSQILPYRALTPDEVREMLLPTLDALAFLHRKNLVQGQLKPPNFLVVNDQLKLASDTIRRAGESTTSIAQSSLYDPPEAKNGRISAAGDIWALGITMVEALTQCPPAWPDERSETASLPTSLPPTFVETVRRCLSRNPADRPTVTDLEAQIKRAPQAPVVSIPQPVVRKATGRATPPQKSPKQRLFVLAITVLFIILVAVWAGLRLFQSNPNSQQPASSTSQTSSQQAAPPATASRNPETFLSASPKVSAPSSSAKSAESKPAPSRPVSGRVGSTRTTVGGRFTLRAP